jgi:ABC-type Co2+ transport system permease subunit
MQMHIEPGIVEGGKLFLGYATAAAAAGYGMKLSLEEISDRGLFSFLARGAITTGMVLGFFEVLPHPAVGVSEVHLILGSSLFLLFGAAPAAIGLALGLLIQGLFFAPYDLPQYGMNLTTLLIPLFGLTALARRIIAPTTPYVDLKYGQVFALSTAFQTGIVLWVSFWAFYGLGFTAHSVRSITVFAASYVAIILIEPLIDLAVLATAKLIRSTRANLVLEERLHAAA